MLVGPDKDGRCVDVAADKVRRRFPDGQSVAVYRGVSEGWHFGVARCPDKQDHNAWPQVHVEFEALTEAGNEVVECFHHRVQAVSLTAAGARTEKSEAALKVEV
mmetsp:Transcript_48856/g.109652  ORF Transcript_48856/g.109652 Transcript_48856/m.109652 type:complete len:104 (+) Transcript_48856:3-314(+)